MNSIKVRCTSCNKKGNTKVTKKNSSKQMTFAIILCILSFGLFVWVPFVIPSMADYDHFCPNCNMLLGQKHATVKHVKMAPASISLSNSSPSKYKISDNNE